MAIQPGAIRKGQLLNANPGNGVSGNPARATEAYGRKALEMKIEAAVAEIRRMRAR